MPCLEFTADDGSYSGYVTLDGSSFTAGVRGLAGYPLIALRDDEVPRRGTSLDVRTHGLWASLTCETPNEHWSVGMEAFAVGYDDPARADGDARGDIVALGFDLEWERAGEEWRVYGDLLVGDLRVDVRATGSVAGP